MTPKPPFERTRCSCARCVRCCKTHPGYMIPGDLERIARHMGEEQNLETFAMTFFRASPGALVEKAGRRFNIGTIIPATDEQGACIFLRGDRCTIHQVAPFGCAYFDMHMNPRTANGRTAWGLQQVHTSDEYREQRKLLPMTSSYRPTHL